MARSKYQGQTDTTLVITLEPYLPTVSLLLAKAGDKEKARDNCGQYVEQVEAADKGAKVPSRVRDFPKN